MAIDWPHAIVTAIILLIILYGLEHSGILDGASKTKRALTIGIVVFVILFVFNLIWPYGATAAIRSNRID